MNQNKPNISWKNDIKQRHFWVVPSLSMYKYLHATLQMTKGYFFKSLHRQNTSECRNNLREKSFGFEITFFKEVRNQDSREKDQNWFSLFLLRNHHFADLLISWKIKLFYSAFLRACKEYSPACKILRRTHFHFAGCFIKYNRVIF